MGKDLVYTLRQHVLCRTKKLRRIRSEGSPSRTSLDAGLILVASQRSHLMASFLRISPKASGEEGTLEAPPAGTWFTTGSILLPRSLPAPLVKKLLNRCQSEFSSACSVR